MNAPIALRSVKMHPQSDFGGWEDSSWVENITMPVEAGLKRRLSALDAVSVVIGIVIGAGIFVTPQELARMLPSSNAMMLAWIVSGGLVFCGALAFAELSAMLPDTGGLYIYLKAAFGPAIAFSSGWVHMFALFSGATAFIAFGFARYLKAIVPFGSDFDTTITIALIVGIGLVNGQTSGQSIFVMVPAPGSVVVLAGAAMWFSRRRRTTPEGRVGIASRELVAPLIR